MKARSQMKKPYPNIILFALGYKLAPCHIGIFGVDVVGQCNMSSAKRESTAPPKKD